jgi:hypothetical protein
MQFEYKGYTVRTHSNNFGDQCVVYTDKFNNIIHEVVNGEGSWDDVRMFKLVINDLIKKTKETK